MIGQGATRSQVISAYGAPSGRTKSGTKEILTYHNGQVWLENGRVERVSMRAKAAPESTPAKAPTEETPKADAPVKETKNPLKDVWIAEFEDASRDAVRRNSPILALFTHNDGSPSSRQFQKEITLHPEFVNAFRTNYVLLHVDAAAIKDASAEDREAEAALRERYGVRNDPALLILSPDGERLAGVEIPDAVPGSAFRGRLIGAVSAAYTLPAIAPVAAPAPVVQAAPAAVPAAPTPLMVAPPEVTVGLTSARWLITGALAAGTIIAALLLLALWIFLRKINKPVALNRRDTIASRIDHAASGLPSHAEIVAWPREKLRRVAARLAELEGYVAEEQPRGSEKDLVLKRPGNPTPEIVVCCVTGNSGAMPLRRVRDMAAMLNEEEVPTGWLVSPMGFSVEARAYAEQHDLRLLDSAALLEQLGDLPTFALPKVLAAVGQA